MNKISAVYRIVNTVTGDFYIGSSKNAKKRWRSHKWSSTWKEYPNSPMYQDMQKYGLDSFSFEILEEVEAQYLKQEEQRLIETLNPTYNDRNSKGRDVERRKELVRKAMKKYHSQLCMYNGETLTLNALTWRFRIIGIPHPYIEAKKYLISK